MLSAASLTCGIKSFISEALNKIEFFFDVIPIMVILNLLAYLITGLISSVSPELLKRIKISFFDILPRSPCEHSFAFIEKEGHPTEDSVLLIFVAIK